MICRRTNRWRVPLLVLLCLSGLVRLAWAEPLLLVAGMPEWGMSERGMSAEETWPDAQLSSIGPDGKLYFQTPRGEVALFPTELVRWSSPRNQSPVSCLVLTDGSRLVLSESWDQRPMISLAAGEVIVHTACLGSPAVSRGQLRAIVLGGPAQSGQYDRLLARLLAWQGPGDQLHLVGGDRLAGRLVGIGLAIPIGQDVVDTARVAASKSRAVDLVTFDSEVGRVTIPRNRVAGLSFQPGQPAQPIPTGLRLGIGLSDGSWLVCSRLVGASADADAHPMRFYVLAGLELSCQDLREVVALQQLGSTSEVSSLVYLSDLEATSYSHQPYLDIPWAYQIDHNAWGGRLLVKGRFYPKGLGMHSAARLTYRLPYGWERMEAEVAIDEVAEGSGSVVFRVELFRGGKWLEAYRSPIVRGGEPPRPLSIDLADAQQLALVTEYADRGDEWDAANWLDARLVRRTLSRESGQEHEDQ